MAKPETNRIICKPDTAERKKYFTANSFAHPAKMVLGLQIYLIEHYTKPGDTILDPMAGSGTILIATHGGRNVILVELEEKFINMQKKNWARIQSIGPTLGHTLGQATILQGDARALNGLLADNILFSPPYALGEGLGHGEKTKSKLRKEKYRSTTYTDKVDAVISSPPYNEEPTCSESYKRIRTAIGRDTTKPSQKYEKYSGKADAVITSPPYEQSNVTGKADSYNGNHGPHSQVQISDYRKSNNNIGNLKGENYLQAMAKVYRECQKVLKPQGLLILVVKNFIRDKKIVRLDTDTIKLCEQAGFKLKERLERKLTQQSFWRTIYKQRFPDAPEINHEDILIFEGK